MDQDVFMAIKRLADKYATELKKQVDIREKEMEDDDTSHYLLYRVLGVILSILVDTFFTRISMPKQHPEIHSISVV